MATHMQPKPTVNTGKPSALKSDVPGQFGKIPVIVASIIVFDVKKSQKFSFQEYVDSQLVDGVNKINSSQVAWALENSASEKAIRSMSVHAASKGDAGIIGLIQHRVNQLDGKGNP